MINIAPLVKSTYPDAKFGVMIVKGIRTAERSIMNKIIAAEIEQIKSRYPDYQRETVLATEPLCYYAAYYKRFKKTYHVLGQLESVLLKGKSIPSTGAPIEAMFLAEIKNLLLTAGHDFDLIEGTLTVDTAAKPMSYKVLSGSDSQLVNNDLYLSDEKGILSSILNGPDYRTRITGNTKTALYFVYGVDGVTEPLIYEHMNTIFSYLSQAVQSAEIQSIEVV